ncbi:MAG: sulfatase [Verrucomicrobia bacterium]|nr:sulfatase [Verrucomicrobiota bacterium]
MVALLAGAVGLGGDLSAAEAPRKPNLLLIVADDLGYAELGVQGGRDVPTPNIDSLAKNGVRFTSGYVSCPVCSPTRAGLMTGRYQQRFGHEFNPGPVQQASAKFGLALGEVTLPEQLKQLGYVTGMFGKWHLGFRPEFHPQKRGFNEFFGFLGGAHAYFDDGTGRGPRGGILRGTNGVEEKRYLTEAFAREAVAFIERNKDRPFFVYLPFNAVHAPLQAPEPYLTRFAALKDDKRRTFAAMLSAMDEAGGRVLDKLRELKLEENTLVFFISDNGGPTPNTTSRNDPLRGRKGEVFEGGIRVPFFVQWKGHLPTGKVSDLPVIALDILPTAVAAAGGKVSPAWKLDGVDLLPYLTGRKSGRPHEALFWRFGPQHAVRKGDWKLVVTRDNARPQLFNLAKDISESTDLAANEPKKRKELQAAYAAWNRQLAEPKWAPQAARTNRPANRRSR